jgi:hypothetical protein
MFNARSTVCPWSRLPAFPASFEGSGTIPLEGVRAVQALLHGGFRGHGRSALGSLGISRYTNPFLLEFAFGCALGYGFQRARHRTFNVA